MLISIHPDNPQPRQLSQVKACLESGGIIAYPTDTIYGLGCDIFHPEAIEKICAIKKVNLEKANLSFICSDLSDLSLYAKAIDNALFRILKKALPGPFTFILPASKQVPKILQSKKKTIGLRIPDNNIARALVQSLGNPIVSTSIRDDDDVLEYTTDPELIFEKWQHLVDGVIDGGFGDNHASTIIDLTEAEPIVIREGKGSVEIL
mgnify:CR=1 FL=1